MDGNAMKVHAEMKTAFVFCNVPSNAVTTGSAERKDFLNGFILSIALVYA